MDHVGSLFGIPKIDQVKVHYENKFSANIDFFYESLYLYLEVPEIARKHNNQNTRFFVKSKLKKKTGIHAMCH